MKIPTYIFCLILLTSLLAEPGLAELQGYIQTFQSLPKLFLAPEEIININLDNYFSGFNLTFQGQYVNNKYEVIDESSLMFNGSEVQISKSMSDADLLRIVNFQPSQQLSWTDFSQSDGLFQGAFYLSLPSDIIGCRDLTFTNINFIIADCFTNSDSYFIMIDLAAQNYTNISNPFNPGKNRVSLVKSEGYMSSDIIYCRFGADWFYVVIAFDLSNFTISWSNTYNFDSFEQLPQNFVLNTLIIWDLETLLVTSGNEIGFIDGAEVVEVIPIGDENNILSKVSTKLVFAPGYYFTSVLYSAPEGIYEVIVDNQLHIVTVNNYKFPHSTTIYSFAQTDSYIGCISSNDKREFYFTIFERGNTDPQIIFYVNRLPGKALIHSLQYKNSQGFFLARRNIQAIYVRKPALEIVNKNPQTYYLDIKVNSLDEVVNVRTEVNQLNEGDDNVYVLNDQPDVVRNVNTSKYFDLSDVFLGPNLTFFLEFDDKENGNLVPDLFYNVNIPINSSATYAKLYADFDVVEIFFQSADNQTILWRYLCNLNDQLQTFDCAYNGSGSVGTVQNMYIHYSYYIIIVENSPSNLSVLVTDKEEDFSEGIVIADGCRLAYLSSDSILEQTTYCILEDSIMVYAVEKHLYTWYINEKVNKLVTHPSFPGLVFISKGYTIEVYWTDFFAKDPVKISSIHVDGTFDFLVTQDSLVVFNLEYYSAEEYDLLDPRNIVPRKRYMLFNYQMLDNKKAFIYSSVTDFLYFLASPPYESPNVYLMGFQTNSPGNSNLKYKYNMGDIMPSNVILDVDYYMLGRDMLLIINGNQTYIQKISSTPYLVLDSLNIENSTELFQSTIFNISAQSLLNRMSTVSVLSTLVNTQRQVSLKQNISVQSLTLMPKGGEANTSFKGEDIFVGPAFYLNLDINYQDDNILLTNRIEAQSIALNLPVLNSVENGIYVALLTNTSINLYDFSYFPQEFHLNHTISNSCEFADMAIDKNSLIVSCADDDTNNFFTYINLSNTSNTCNFYVDYLIDEIYMKVSGKYVYILIPYIFNTLLIYELNENCAELAHTVSTYELGLKVGEMAYSIDVYTSNDNKTTFVFVTTASSMFKTVIIKEGSKPYVTAFPKIDSILAFDHFNNDETMFSGIRLHSVVENGAEDLLAFELLISSLNAFTYLMHCMMTRTGEYHSCYSRKGFIQYQGYDYMSTVWATSRYFALIGKSQKTRKNNVFLYDLEAKSNVPNHQRYYPLFDSFQAMPAPLTKGNPTLLFDKGEYHLMLFYNSSEKKFDEYIIRENFTIYSNASHLSSQSVMVIGKNDFWASEYGVPVVNYGALFRGVSSLLIVLIVFFSLVFIFLMFVCVNRYCRFKEKRGLKDEMNYAVQNYFSMDKDA